MKFSVVVRDPQISLYERSDLVDCIIVEADCKDDAIREAGYDEFIGGYFYNVARSCDDMELGDCNFSDIRYPEVAS